MWSSFSTTAMTSGKIHPGEFDERQAPRARLLSGLLYCARCSAKMWAETIPAGVISTTGQVHKAGRLADALAQRPVSETLLCKLDEAEVEARRLTEKIAATQAELVTMPTSN
jgi:hypothetical protein